MVGRSRGGLRGVDAAILFWGLGVYMFLLGLFGGVRFVAVFPRDVFGMMIVMNDDDEAVLFCCCCCC